MVWSEADAERHVENFLAALAAGAYEQAAWSAANNGVVVTGQESDETAEHYFERVCEGGHCLGPYLVEADGPGLVNQATAQASSTVAVTHVPSGETGPVRLGTFEGQLIIADLPPLFASTGEPALVESLFGDEIPSRVVVQRFDAFEIWEGGTSDWVTNWWSDDATQIEQDMVVTWPDGVVDLRDPTTTYAAACGRLITRADEVLVLEHCWSGEWELSEIRSGESRSVPIDFEQRDDGEFVWFDERGGTVISGIGDAEGNLVTLESSRGVDLAADDYIGYLALSVDGSMVAYVDHRDPAAYSHFWSPVVVVKSVANGDELGRWVLDNPVLCLQFASDWVVACEADGDADLASGMPAQGALVAINPLTGDVSRVETPSLVFLPS